MPPIPVHIDDPITPAKAQAATPQTADVPTPTTNDATTTQPANNTSPYPSARPGVAAVAAPTASLPRPQPAPTRTTQRTPEQYNGPPPPQPGAVPVPQSQQAPMTTPSSLPPPPRAGEAPQPITMPAQMQIPPPGSNYAPTHSTAGAVPPPSTAYQPSGPTTLNLGPIARQPPPQTSQYSSAAETHPPGYQQDPYAAELSSAQRASLEHLESEERRGSFAAGLLRTDGAASETAESAWGTVKSWATAAGAKVSEAEKEVWKMVDGEK